MDRAALAGRQSDGFEKPTERGAARRVARRASKQEGLRHAARPGGGAVRPLTGASG